MVSEITEYIITLSFLRISCLALSSARTNLSRWCEWRNFFCILLIFTSSSIWSMPQSLWRQVKTGCLFVYQSLTQSKFERSCEWRGCIVTSDIFLHIFRAVPVLIMNFFFLFLFLSGYLYGHVSYLADDCEACLLLLSVDREQFFTLSEAKQKIVDVCCKSY